MKHFKMSGSARMSVGIYNTKEEIDNVVKILKALVNSISP